MRAEPIAAKATRAEEKANQQVVVSEMEEVENAKEDQEEEEKGSVLGGLTVDGAYIAQVAPDSG